MLEVLLVVVFILGVLLWSLFIV